MTFQKQDLHLLKKKTITNDCLKTIFGSTYQILTEHQYLKQWLVNGHQLL